MSSAPIRSLSPSHAESRLREATPTSGRAASRGDRLLRSAARLPSGLKRLYRRLARQIRQRVLTGDFFAAPLASGPLIDSDLFRDACANDPLVLIDGGARGELFAPFRDVDSDRLFVVRFEPDPEAVVVDSSGGRTIARGLWCEPGKIDLHLAETPSASSVFPPDEELLSCFPDHVGYPPRRTQRTIEIEVDSIDHCSEVGAIPKPDFIKLDVHGAEYEALLGARGCLGETVLAVLVETWAIPIHRGQKTHGAVESLLNEHGFRLQKQRVNSLWPRSHPALEDPEDVIVAYESLYVRDPFSGPGRGAVSTTSALKAIAIADLFRSPVLALQLNDAAREAGVLEPEQWGRIEACIANRYGDDR